jgi:hypothetical protein
LKNIVIKVGDEWVAWNCSEEPQSIFLDTMAVDVTRGEGYSKIPPEFIESVLPDTIRVQSIVPDCPAYTCGEVYFCSALKTWVLQVQTRTGLFRRNARKATVRIEAVKRFAAPRWDRFTKAQKESNDFFWSQAKP